MGSTPKTLPRRRAPREQVVLGACPNCGSARVVQPCSNQRCDAWFMVCDCNDASETSYVCGGRCEGCRTLDSEQRDPWEPTLARPVRTSGGKFRSPYAPRPNGARRGHEGPRAKRSTKGGA